MSRGPGGRVGEKREREELGCYCRCWHARTRSRSIYLGVVITSKKSQAVLCMEFQNFDNIGIRTHSTGKQSTLAGWPRTRIVWLGQGTGESRKPWVLAAKEFSLFQMQDLHLLGKH